MTLSLPRYTFFHLRNTRNLQLFRPPHDPIMEQRGIIVVSAMYDKCMKVGVLSCHINLITKGEIFVKEGICEKRKEKK